MQRMRIDHLTEYRFSSPLALMPHRMMLRPRENHGLRIVSSKLDITPLPSIRWHRDALDNSVAVATFTGVTSCLRIESSVVVEHHDEEPLDFVVEDHAVVYPFGYIGPDSDVLAPFRSLTWPHDGAALEGWLAHLELRAGAIETYVLLHRMNRAIHERMRCEVREEPGVQSPALTLARGSGACRDLAALFMESCRQLGLASRFMSGYLHAPGTAEGATHAWAEVYIPGAGWKGFDPTCGRLTGADHVAVAAAHHPEHVPPVAGSFLGSAAERPTMLATVRVQRLAV